VILNQKYKKRGGQKCPPHFIAWRMYNEKPIIYDKEKRIYSFPQAP
jgi:hypothetical protein